MKPLTKKQKRVLDFVGKFSDEQGFPPTLREIGEAIDLPNISAVRGHVAALEKKGYIKKDPDKARSIRVVHTPSVLSRLKHKLHEYAQTDKGVIHRVVYGLVLVTCDSKPIFTSKQREHYENALSQRAVEHGWSFLDIRIEPNYVVLIVEVWPNHSPELVVARIKDSGNSVWRKFQEKSSRQSLWTTGYGITTDLEYLDDIVQQLLAKNRPANQNSVTFILK